MIYITCHAKELSYILFNYEKEMIMNKHFVISIICITFFFCFSCENENGVKSFDDEEVKWSDYSANIPVLGKSDGAFSYVVVGDDFSATCDETIVFDAKNVSIAIVIDSYEVGTGKISIKNDSSNVIFEKEISSNMVYAAVTELEDIPGQIVLSLKNFTGNMEFALAESDSEAE